MGLRKRRTRKVSKSFATRLMSGERIELECSKCGRLVENLSPDTASVICSWCVQLMVAPPQMKDSNKEKRPRGWQFKKRYVSPSGIVYSFGKEVKEDGGTDRIRKTSVAKTKKKKPKKPKK